MDDLMLYRIRHRIVSRKRVSRAYKNALLAYVSVLTVLFTYLSVLVFRKKGAAVWEVFEPGPLFWWGSASIALLTGFISLAHHFAKDNDIRLLRISLIGAISAIVVFLSVLGANWAGLHAEQLLNTPPHAYYFLITAFYAIQFPWLLFGLIYALVQAYRYQLHSRNMIPMLLIVAFSTYLALLWAYLSLFMFIVF